MLVSSKGWGYLRIASKKARVFTNGISSTNLIFIINLAFTSEQALIIQIGDNYNIISVQSTDVQYF